MANFYPDLFSRPKALEDFSNTPSSLPTVLTVRRQAILTTNNGRNVVDLTEEVSVPSSVSSIRESHFPPIKQEEVKVKKEVKGVLEKINYKKIRKKKHGKKKELKKVKKELFNLVKQEDLWKLELEQLEQGKKLEEQKRIQKHAKQNRKAEKKAEQQAQNKRIEELMSALLNSAKQNPSSN